MDETESLLENCRQSNRRHKVEIIVNDCAYICCSDVSPYGKCVDLMKAKYPNLDFVV